MSKNDHRILNSFVEEVGREDDNLAQKIDKRFAKKLL